MSEKTRTWLFNYLFDAEGPVPSREIRKAAENAGFSRTSLYNAREALNITVTRSNTVPSTTYWELTGSSLSPPENPTGRRLPRWAREELTALRLKVKSLQNELHQLRSNS